MKIRLPKRDIPTVGSAIISVGLVAFGFLTSFPDFLFHVWVAIALIVGMTPPAINRFLRDKRERAMDDAIPRILDDIADSQETGMTLLQALEESSHRKYE